MMPLQYGPLTSMYPRSLSMDVVQAGKEPMKFISSAATDSSEGLLAIKYNRVQPESPQFLTVYEGINQSVDITVTTVVVRAAPVPVIALYDFIMTTFVPEKTGPDVVASLAPEEDSGEETVVPAGQENSSDKLKVLLKLAGIQGK